MTCDKSIPATRADAVAARGRAEDRRRTFERTFVHGRHGARSGARDGAAEQRYYYYEYCLLGSRRVKGTGPPTLPAQ